MEPIGLPNKRERRRGGKQRILPRQGRNSAVPRWDGNRWFSVCLSLAVAFQCVWTFSFISVGVSAFSATTKPPLTPRENNNQKNHKNYDPSLLREAQKKFDAWRTANPNTHTLREYIVQQEDLEDVRGSRNARIGHFATRVFPDSLPTSNAANRACRGGSLTLNATQVSGGRFVGVGDVLAYNTTHSAGDRRTAVPSDPGRAERFCASRLRLLQTLQDESLSHSPLRVLYEDHCMAIVCKPAGIHSMSWSGSLGKSLCLDEILPLVLTPPGAGAAVGTIFSSAQDEPNSEKDGWTCDAEDEGLPAPLPRHRLDHRVAGPVVVAKTRRASVEIGRAFEEKRVAKEYRAIVVGTVDRDAIQGLLLDDGVISNLEDAASSSSSSGRLSFTISSDVDGKPSETEVQVLGRTPCNIHGVLTDLRLFPKTGRKHQLRIHCARVLGTPILGDDLYWDDDTEGVAVRKRQGLYLYCKRVSMDHPLRGSHKVVSAEIQEPLRFTRTRTKARKGYEWNKAHAESSEDDTSHQDDSS